MQTSVVADTVPLKLKRPMWRRIARVTSIVFASLLALVVLGVVFLHTSWGKSIVRRRVEAKLAASVNGSVKLASLDYTFLFGTIELGGLEIRDATGRKAIGLASLKVDLDRRSVIAGAPVIDDLRVEGLDVAIVKHADGSSNLTGLFKPSPKRKPLSHVRIAKLSVSGGARVSKPDGTELVVTDLAIAGSLDARPAVQQLEVGLAKLAANVEVAKPGMKPKHIPVAIASVSLARSREAIDVDVKNVVAGALAIESIGAHVKLANGHLQGAQSITLGKARLNSKQLAAMLGRELLVDDLAVDATISGPADALAIAGTVQTRGAKLALDGKVDAAAARPTYQLSLVGTGLRSDVLATHLPPLETELRIDVEGAGKTPADLDAEVTLAVGATKLKTIPVDGLDAKLIAHHGSYRLEHFSARGLAFELAAEGELAADKTVRGQLTVHGNPAKAIKVLAAAGIAVPRRVPVLKKLDVAVSASGNLDGALAVEVAPTKLAIAGGEIALAGTAKFDHRVLQTAHTQIDLRTLDLASLARLAGKQPKLHGSLSGTVALSRTATTQHADYSLALALPKLAITAKGKADATSATANAEVRRASDRALLATLAAQLPLDKQGLQRSGKWHVALDLGRRPIAELAALLPKPLRLPPGSVELHVDVGGSPAQPMGTFAVAGDNVDLHGTLTSSARGLAVATKGSVSLERSPLALVDATLALPPPFATGKLDVKALRAGASIDAKIDIPARPLASLATLRPKLATFDGNVDGHISVRGSLAMPSIDAMVRWVGYRTATGAMGETSLIAYGTPASLIAKLDHGHGAVAIVATVQRQADRLDVRTFAHANETDLMPLLPAFLAGKLAGCADPGRLRWDMEGTFALARNASGRLALESADVTGTFDVRGAALQIPKSKRRWHDVNLSVAADAQGVHITSLALHESDLENRDRRLNASGLLTFANRRPQKLTLDLAAHDWLLFGSPLLGPSDAPKAAADFDITVAADLTTEVPSIDATVRSLALRAPERFERAHQPEVVSFAGDVIYLRRGGPAAGTLPVAPPPVPEAPTHRRPLDLRIHIPTPIHLVQAPFDVMARGELTVTVRDEGVKTRGVLKMDSGSLWLFGQTHPLVDGSVSFTDEHPHGWMALTFERKLPDAILRDLAHTSTSGARVTFVGSPTKPKTTLSGAANSALMEVMAMHSAGRAVYATRPGMPASATVQAPRGDQLNVLTYIATNLPHLLFLDRISAWADPYRSPYGRIENLEAEKYARDERSRVRAVMRPQTPGRSSAELQYDRLLIHNDRAAAGIGVRAGDRLGGGVGVFVEWSSKD